MGAKGGSNTPITGYRYYMGFHMVLCHGPVDRVYRMIADDEIVWEGDVESGEFLIDAPDAYGGDEREGGIVGTFEHLKGDKEQLPNSYLVSAIESAFVSAYRGVCSIVAHKVYVGNNPFIKAMKFVAERIMLDYKGEEQWYPAKAAIIADAEADIAEYDMNPAHIIRECLVSDVWGLGQGIADGINEASFLHAADVFHEERLGLSFIWNQEDEEIRDFIQLVQMHCDCAVYVDPKTGLWEIVPIRGDYDIDEIPVVFEEDIMEVSDLAIREYAECVNYLTVTYRDINYDKKRSLVIQNIAAIQQAGRVIKDSVDFPGVFRDDLAATLGKRELLSLGLPLMTGTITLPRSFAYLRVGKVFRVFSNLHRMDGVVFRIMDISEGNGLSNSVSFDVSEDIFSFELQDLATPNFSKTQKRIAPLTPITGLLLEELPYYIAARRLPNVYLQDEITADPDMGILITMAANPTKTGIGYYLNEMDGGDKIRDIGASAFYPYLELGSDLLSDPTDTEFVYRSNSGWNESFLIVGDFLFSSIGEVMVVTEVNHAVYKITVKRGCLDTVPKVHNPGDLLYSFRDGSPFFMEGFSGGMSVDIRTQPYSSKEILPLFAANNDNRTIVFDSRMQRPYVPGNLQVDYGAGFVYVYEGAPWGDDADFSWVHRNRLTQTTATVLSYDAAGVTSEAGVTYRVLIQAYADLTASPIATFVDTNVGSATTYALTGAGSHDTTGANYVVVEIRSVRGSYESHDSARVVFVV